MPEDYRIDIYLDGLYYIFDTAYDQEIIAGPYKTESDAWSSYNENLADRYYDDQRDFSEPYEP